MKVSTVIISVLIAGVSLFAAPGTVNQITATSDGVIKVNFNKDAGGITTTFPIVGTADALKNMTAVLLTAKSSGAAVDYSGGDYLGTVGWKQIILK